MELEVPFVNAGPYWDDWVELGRAVDTPGGAVTGGDSKRR